jgi:hypothetical protein
MYPVTELPSFQLATPDATAEDILDALEVLGDSLDIPQRLIRALVEYMERYTNDSGLPIFSAEGYFELSESGTASSADLAELDVVDSFSMSITLTLAALTFIQNFRQAITRKALQHEMDRLQELSNIRLTAAMVGLYRSFSLSVFDVQSDAGRILRERSNQPKLPEHQIIGELRQRLGYVRSRLRDLTIGSGQAVADLDSPNRLFECGWSWGIVKDTPPVGTELLDSDTLEKFVQSDGVAADRPYLYFTGIALDGLEDLFSERTRLLGLLDEGQRRLLTSLQIRRDLTQRYWSTIATFGTDRWPLEDLPWRTSDTQESDYYSLQVSSTVVQDLVSRRAPDSDLGRVGNVLRDLANRSRIDRRAMSDDAAALELHAPGVPLKLDGGEKIAGQPMIWRVSNFAPLLLKRTLAVAELMRDADQRGELLTLADKVWAHLLLRRLKQGPAQGLWDQPGDAFEQLSTHHELPSWYQTERVVECLVMAANMVERASLRNERLIETAKDLLYEADLLYDRELLLGSGEAGPAMRGVLESAHAKRQHAWEILKDRPGSAVALASEVLRELERLAVARRDAAQET